MSSLRWRENYCHRQPSTCSCSHSWTSISIKSTDFRSPVLCYDCLASNCWWHSRRKHSRQPFSEYWQDRCVWRWVSHHYLECYPSRYADSHSQSWQCLRSWKLYHGFCHYATIIWYMSTKCSTDILSYMYGNHSQYLLQSSDFLFYSSKCMRKHSTRWITKHKKEKDEDTSNML